MRYSRYRGKSAANQPLSCCSSRLYASGMASEPPLLFIPVGRNEAQVFGMDARERTCRLATNAGFECADGVLHGRAALLASMRYAWDPAWLRAMRARPGTILTLDSEPVMVHVAADA